jgi:hypothetical protein
VTLAESSGDEGDGAGTHAVHAWATGGLEVARAQLSVGRLLYSAGCLEFPAGLNWSCGGA